MALFTERMEAVTNEILNSRNHREAAVLRLKVETGQILNDGRTLLKRISDQTRAQTMQCRKHLLRDRRALSKHVHSLREKNRRDLSRSGNQLRESLAENSTGRHDAVHELLQGFAQAQQSLAADLRGAAILWRESQQRTVASHESHGHRPHKDARSETAHKKGHVG